jgi:uncharacterized protein (DUF1800 family)
MRDAPCVNNRGASSALHQGTGHFTMSTHCSIRRIAGRRLWAMAMALALTACGGGGGAPTTNQSSGESVNQLLKGLITQDGDTVAEEVKPSYQDVPATDADAARFLTQATFGPTDAAVQEVRSLGYRAWIERQLARQPSATHLSFWQIRDAEKKAIDPAQNAQAVDFTYSFWRHALTGDDQLRQRVAYALSQIFVVSSMDGCGANNSNGLANYYDMLTANAFGSYRQLLEDVSLHPVMGCYLSHLKNQKENQKTGRVPDENFAREIMQLFSIGLYQLNQDGTPKSDSAGNLLETYGSDDVAGLAKVFTGFSFDCPDHPSDNCFANGGVNGGTRKYADLWVQPMKGYSQFHSFSTEKSFLGTIIPAQSQPDPQASLKAALDTLATTHPNVGPFIGKQLIQRLVTSNPSPAYVARVTAAFEGSGRNLGAMVTAILLDPEARDTSALTSNTFGKVREPVLRLSALLRAVGASSDSGRYLIDFTDDQGTSLGQTPMRAPSVFNFYRPGYVYPGGASAAAGLVAPELQIVNESSVAGYVNYMRDVLRYGAGRNGVDFSAPRRDVQLTYIQANSPWLALAARADAGALVDDINRVLMYGTMPAALKQEIKLAVEAIKLRNPVSTADTEVRYRLWSAFLLTLASPEFLVQR